jgi:dUTP pyrophosphatase
MTNDDIWRWAERERKERIRKIAAKVIERHNDALRNLNDGGDTMKVNVKIKRLHPDAVIPRYAHEFDAGFDLVAVEDVVIEPGETKLVRTGLAISLPPGYELQVRPRSGISLRTKLRVVLGTVDSGYRGEIGVIVDNIADKYVKFHANEYGVYEITDTARGNVFDVSGSPVESISFGKYPHNTYIIRKGDRIAQAVIKPVEQARFVEVDELDETERGTGGFGSTGVKQLDELLAKITPENRHEEIDM